MKMRALVVSGKGKLKTIGELLAKNGTYAADVIPPAYSCDRERLVVIIASLKANMPDSFRRFCQELSKDKAQNVALIVDGKEADAKMVANWISEAGANVIMPNLYPNDIRDKYMLYDGKLSTWIEGAESLKGLISEVEKSGFNIVIDRGDYREIL